MSSLRDADKEAGAHAVAPRVSFADIEAAIAIRYDFTGEHARQGVTPSHANAGFRCDKLQESLKLLSICILVMGNGFTVIGKSAPASAANFNADLGRTLAYEDAIRQLWPLMGYALRDRLAAGHAAG